MSYTESTVTGHRWNRCNQIVVENRRGALPIVRFEEETVVALADGAEVRTPTRTLTLDFDPNRQVALRDPRTGEPTGETMSYALMYAVLYSAYIDAAESRDAIDNPQRVATEE